MLRNRRRITKALNTTISRSEAEQLGQGGLARITGLEARARRRRREKAGLEIERDVIVV
jgi:hypothetical protein